MPWRSKTFRTPAWAMPRANPPPSASPIRGAPCAGAPRPRISDWTIADEVSRLFIGTRGSAMGSVQLAVWKPSNWQARIRLRPIRVLERSTLAGVTARGFGSTHGRATSDPESTHRPAEVDQKLSLRSAIATIAHGRSELLSPFRRRGRAVDPARPRTIWRAIRSIGSRARRAWIVPTASIGSRRPQPRCASAADPLLEVFGIALAVHRDLCRGILDSLQIRPRELHVRGADVLLEAMQLRGAGDRDDPRLPR